MKRQRIQYLWGMLALMLLIYILLHDLLGGTLFAHEPLDSYTLQALAWREGRLSLGQDYPWLELAIYQGDWYVSFPPFPSVVMLPLTYLFGENTPNNLLIILYRRLPGPVLCAGLQYVLDEHFRRGMVPGSGPEYAAAYRLPPGCPGWLPSGCLCPSGLGRGLSALFHLRLFAPVHLLLPAGPASWTHSLGLPEKAAALPDPARLHRRRVYVV